MFEYINANPIKALVFALCLLGAILFVSLNLKKPKTLFFFVIFYIPLSFTTNFGCLSTYLILFLYIWSLQYKYNLQYKYKSSLTNFQFDNFLVFLLFLITIVAMFQNGVPSFFYRESGKIRLTKEYWLIITMLSSIFIYLMTKKFITTKEDLLKVIKIMVISGTIASIAGYFQWIFHGKTYFFKYIVLGENPKWVYRISATMQGYEILAEYVAILIVFSFILLMISQKKLSKFFYFLLILNFVIIMTLTQTRGIYIALILTCIYFGILSIFFKRFALGIKFIFLSFFIVISLFLFIFLIDKVRPESHFLNRFLELKSTINIKQGQFADRTGTYLYGVNTIKKMNFREIILGGGYKYIPRYKSKHGVIWPHCLYLSYLLRDGILGLSVLLIFFAWLYKRSLLSFLKNNFLKDNNLFIIGAGLHFAFVMFLIDEFKIEFIRSDRSYTLYWLFFALISVYSNIVYQQVRNFNKNKI